MAPGAVNVIPGTATFTVDLRARHDHERDDSVTSLEAVLREICERRGLRYRLTELHAASSVQCADRLLEAAREGVDAVQRPEPPTLFSPAGHDGMAVAAVADVGMIFMRNPDGISHHPAEYVSPDDLGLGTAALATAVRALS